MVEIQLHSDSLCTDTMVPDKFIDNYMPAANGEFVKVYLYLLRCLHSHAYNCTISAIADRFNNTENDVLRALNYWEKQGLLTLSYDSAHKLCAIRLRGFEDQADSAWDSQPPTDAASKTPTDTPVEKAQVASDTPTVPIKREYSLDEINQFRKDSNISELFFVVESYIRHPLSENDTSTVLFWYEDLHFSTELIVYLLEYCISKGHSSMRYLDKVAMGWYENHITTVEQAKEDAAIHSQAYYGVMKAFGITGRSLVESETSYIKKWTKDYAFDLPLIQEACSRTVSATHQPSFEYADSILTSWHNNHVHTQADIAKLDLAHSKNRRIKANTADSAPKKNSFNNFNQRNYDYDKLEELLLTTSLHG